MRMQWLTLGIAAAVLGGCAEQPGPTEVEVSVPLYAMGGNADFNLETHLVGDEEVFTPTPPSTATPADSRAQGQAIFRISDDEKTASFRLIASNIDNVIMAHIHCAPAGMNGGIRIWLYPVVGTSGSPTAPGGGPQNGVLATGTFSLENQTCPAIAATATTPAYPAVSLLEALRTGRTYVNVHTNDGVAPANTGPGDFPGGEIRGQIDDENR